MQRPLVSAIGAGLLACSIDVTLEGKLCDANGACPSGLRCDPVSNTCVTDSGLAADWTDSMIALYTFDDAGDPTRDATRAERHLSLVGQLSVGSDAPPQGAGYLMLEGSVDGHLQIVDAAFTSARNASFTFGLWLRPDGTGAAEPAIIRRWAAGAGYNFEWSRDFQRSVCSVGATSGHGSPEGSSPVGQWVHSVCRFEALNEHITAVHNGLGPDDDLGSAVDSATVGDPGDDAPFYVPAPGAGFGGGVDEVFFINKDLTTESIRRIQVCGVDGRRCRCDAAAPKLYLDCGPWVCSTQLPPCDQPVPDFKSP